MINPIKVNGRLVPSPNDVNALTEIQIISPNGRKWLVLFEYECIKNSTGDDICSKARISKAKIITINPMDRNDSK